MPGLKGLVAQGLNGRKGALPAVPLQILDVVAPGSGTFTANFAGILTIVLWGGGGSGQASNGSGAGGGGGGGCVFKRVRVSAGQQIPYVNGAGGTAMLVSGPGNPGGATSATLPNGTVIVATGGQGGAGGLGGAGGTGLNGDDFGVGGSGAAVNNTGSPGGNGGDAGAIGGPVNGGSGGAASVASSLPGLPFYFRTNLSSVAGSYGHGSLGDSTGGGSAVAVPGRVLMILQRYGARP